MDMKTCHGIDEVNCFLAVSRPPHPCHCCKGRRISLKPATPTCPSITHPSHYHGDSGKMT
ncbi:hypothetical protein E2C01_043687 [Portunus trituberculatus]|uniref:Uncharacterized protein n=1 Tax=Portunus trituberculatus TaxID=210409 RepID=A0A5B7FTL3_PORTR|nr:hypothetical protein [Portunus trituberculatus]